MISFAAMLAPSDSTPDIQKNSILEINTSMQVKSVTSNDYSSILDLETPEQIKITDLIHTIHKAADDSRIAAILLHTDNNSIPVAYQNEMLLALDSFRNNGKKIYAYGTQIDQNSYYLAASADSIFIHPRGMLLLMGYSADVVFYKGLMDKLGVAPQIFYAGDFKSATEPFRLKKMSEPNKLQVGELLDDFWSLLITRIAKSRNISPSQVESIINSGNSILPEDALSQKLVDATLYRDQLAQILGEKLNWSIKDKMDDKIINIIDYKSQPSRRGNSKIGLLHFSGEIVGDYNPYASSGISAEEYLPIIEELADDEKIKAVVIHVNSPGGDAIASDKIWHSLKELNKVKPVICYMSSVAASGGYYIAAAARKIIAQPHTITGSIGVFMLSFNAEKLFENKLGISFDNVQRGDLANYGEISRPMTEKEKSITQKMVDNIYERFLEIASTSRNIPITRMREIAQGRVYSGKDAQELNLVDDMGYLRDALEVAATMAKLEAYKISEYPQREESPFQALLKSANAKMNQKSAIPLVDDWYTELQTLALKNRKIMTELPFQMKIHGLTIK